MITFDANTLFMIHPATITFLQHLERNNNKPWFDAHKDEYAAAKDDFEQVVAALLAGLCVHEPGFKEQRAKDCVFRIFRDVRFSKDKTPYKPNFGAFFSKGGRKYPGAGYYLHLQPGGKSFAGGGLWEPDAPLLKSVRQEVDYNFNEFSKIITEKKFKKLFAEIKGDRLVKVPQGYSEDNPAIEYLKLKSFTVMHYLTDDDIKNKSFEKKVVEVFDTMRPFVEFLNRALD